MSRTASSPMPSAVSTSQWAIRMVTGSSASAKECMVSTIARASRKVSIFFMGILLFSVFYFHRHTAVRTYSLMEPIITPLTKYFCTKGYTHRIGNAVITIVPICTDWAGTFFPEAICAIRESWLFMLMSTSRR